MCASVLMVRGASEAPTAHAYQMGDATNKFGYVSFPVNDVASKKIDKTSGGSYNQLGAADYVNGKLYGFTLELDDFGAIISEDYVVLDPANDFKQLSSVSKYYSNRVVDMAYDYTTNRMYALVELKNTTSKIVKTALHVVDLANGDVFLVGLPGDLKALDGYGRETEEILVALAASPTGELYAMGDYRQFYKVDKVSGLATPVGTRHKVAIDNKFQTMAFSADGNLYHAHCHPDYEYFMRIDPADGKIYNPVTGEEVTVNADFTNNAHRISGDPQLTALYFTDHVYDAESPAAITSFSATLRANTSNTVDLTWGAPVAKTAVTGIWVYRFGATDVLAKLPADAVAYTDDSAPNGQVAYTVVAVSDGHVGLPAYVSVQAGADQLKAVTDLKAELDGTKVNLSWNAPTATVKGGYADYDHISYIVTQVSGSKRTVLEQNCTETSYQTELSDGGTFKFEVVPVSCGIEGVAALSNEVTVAKTFAVPYFTGFEDDQDGTLWTTKNKSTGTFGWSIVKGSSAQQYDGKFLKFYTGGTTAIPADDWAFSPAIYFEQGDYLLTYLANGSNFDTHTYEVAVGTDPEDITSFGKVIEKIEAGEVYDSENKDNKNFQLHKVAFSIPATGAYHIGFHGIGSSIYATLRIDNLAIDKDPTSGIGDSVTDTVPSGVTVVSIDGRVIMRDAAPEALDNLQRGIYIVNGRKICITK